MFWSSFWPSAEIPCKLRRLATGLSWLGWSRFIVASLRFSDPLLGTIELSLLVSSDLRKAICTDPETSSGRLRRFSGLEVIGLDAPSALFSCPEISIAESAGAAGRELPLSGAVMRALFNGLFGDTRARVSGLDGDVFAALAERNESLTLGRNGVKADDGAP